MNKDDQDIEKAKAHTIVEIVEYVSNAILNRTILKKTTGNVTVSAFDAGEEIAEKSSAFDAFIQIIDGSAEIVIDSKKYRLTHGQGIIIPAHQRNSFYAKEPFKMISTVIKSGYE